jgi:hypothetical protein
VHTGGAGSVIQALEEVEAVEATTASSGGAGGKGVVILKYAYLLVFQVQQQALQQNQMMEQTKF